MDDIRAVSLKELLNKQLKKLYALWDGIGFDETTQQDRSKTVEDHFKVLLDRMIAEENELTARLVSSLEYSMNQCVKLSKELSVTYQEPDSEQALIELENVLRGEVKRLESLRRERMIEQTNLRRKERAVFERLGLDPYNVSTNTVLSPCQLEGRKEHIRSLETEKVVRLEQFEKWKTEILTLYKELEEEPETDFEREVACEDTDRFVLSTANITKVGDVVNKLEMKTSENKRLVREAAEKVESLCEYLQLSLVDKFHLNTMNQGHGSS